MPAAADILQKFATEDWFDAELDEDSDNGGLKTGSCFEDAGCKAPELPDLSGDEKATNEETVNHASDEETSPKKKNDRKKKKSRRKSPKPQRIKKADVLAIHSESQRMVRESVVQLPYHMPTVQPITHFLKRVPGLVDEKETDRTKGSKTTPVSPSKQENCKDNPYEISSPLPGDTATTASALKGIEGITATTPKLSAATDPFFSNTTPTPTLTDHRGVQSLMKRFVKHTSKPQEKLKVPMKKERNTDEHTSEHTPLISDNKLNKNTPGARFQYLREQLQKKIKVQRAEKRKILESQWKLDNEEISEEGEAEDSAEETDEEDDSDYELDKWNKDDEKKQEEGDSDLDETAEHEENKAKTRSAFIDDEADESDDADYGVCDIDSGSEGDVSDGNESDDGNDDKSVFSDDKISLVSKDVKEKRDIKSKQATVNCMEEQTLDLFNDSSAQYATKEMDRLRTISNRSEGDESGGSFGSLHLRLDSMEDDEDTAFTFPRSPVNSKVGSRGNKSKVSTSFTNFSELSQQSSQSSTCMQRLVSSELGESANSLEASSDSSRIPPGQGDGVGTNGEMCSGRDTPEIFSFARLRHLISPPSEGTEQATKKPGKLSQLTLPIEDSQDLFDDEHDRNGDHDRQGEPSNDFHFSLDEDTQFTQILNTQGFINSTKKSKTKGPKLFEDERATSSQPCMDELLGLCSGGFTDSNCTQAVKTTEDQGTKTGQSVFCQFDTQGKQSNMNELLGLCSGRFTDDEEQEMDTEVTDIKIKGQKCDDDEEEEEGGGNREDKEGSDPEEMVLKRKYGKKYETKRRGIFDKRNFLEEEAELSGSDMGSDEDEDIATDEDVIEEESEVEDIPTDEELQKQINKVHMKSMRDQDNAELRTVKEMFLPDGDLYTDGQGRTRHFRWRGIDENSQLDFFGNKELWGEDEDVGTELISEEEIKRRRERYERETFLREEVSKEKRDLLDIDESSQKILNIIRDTSSHLAEGPDKPQAIVNPKKNMAPAFKRKTSQKGSFLNHSKAKLSRLSSLTSNTPNASATTRGFVFQSVSPPNKDLTKGKRMQRTNSLIDLPTSKKPRLDRSLSDSNSVFAML